MTKAQLWEQLVLEAIFRGRSIQKITDVIIARTNSEGVDKVQVRKQVILALGRLMKQRIVKQYTPGEFWISNYSFD